MDGAAPVAGPSKEKRTRSGPDGPYRRSRTGCGTCKKRGKKCDEVWDAAGQCQRCVKGKWTCSGKSDGPVKKEDGLDPPPPSTSTTTSPPTHPPTTFTTTTTSTSTSGAAASVGHPLTINTAVDQHPHQHQHQNQHQHQHSHLPPALTALASTSTHPQPPFDALGVPVLPVPPGEHEWWSDFFQSDLVGTQSLDALQPYDPAAPRMGSLSSLPLFMNHSLAAPSPTQYDATGGVFGFNVPSPATPYGNPFAVASASVQAVATGSRGEPTRQGVSLGDIYTRVVESWLVGLPPATRAQARGRIASLHKRDGALRAVRFAVSAAYIFLFASAAHEAGKATRLRELARKGAGIATPVSNVRGEPSDEEGEGEDQRTTNLSAYQETVTNPFEGDQQSQKWMNDAMMELRTVLPEDMNHLSDLLWGVIDLQCVEFIRGGAGPSYQMLALGDRLVRHVFGVQNPTLDLTTLCTSDKASLRLYAISDISRCIVNRGQRTIFNFRQDTLARRKGSEVADEAEEPWSTYLGLPHELIILLAEIVNLCAAAPTLSPTNVKSQAQELEEALRAWKFNPAPGGVPIDSCGIISRAIAGELWRQSAIILLYQSVYRAGSVHPVLRAAQSELLSLLDSVASLPNGDLSGFIALPSFLSASLSISEVDRTRSMRHLRRAGPEKVWLDNVALINRLWEEADSTGWLIDWNDKMRKDGLAVAFF
ncbi:hypothetical protein MNV49_005607 [Pseudohyphozyma bogoriensis]|nr:hypothetical protein MNV49_005607 [Pseudohyphozyma bogoriensis]